MRFFFGLDHRRFVRQESKRAMAANIDFIPVKGFISLAKLGLNSTLANLETRSTSGRR
jgi:hypothetical protein